MYNPVQLAFKYIQYWLTAASGKGHGIHSPFVYSLVQQVLHKRKPNPTCTLLEAERKLLLQNNTMLAITDFGAGSRVNNQQSKSVANIAKSALKPQKYASLLYRLAQFVQAKQVVELGTSLGITTAYLAQSNPYTQVYTFEGSEQIAQQANNLFQKLGLQQKIKVTVGNFDETLPQTLPHLPKIDFAFIDGNHRLQPTLQYFEQLLPQLTATSVVIFDDIHWSTEMEAAWQQVINRADVMLSVDLFFVGLVFFNPDFKVKQHFTIRY